MVGLAGFEPDIIAPFGANPSVIKFVLIVWMLPRKIYKIIICKFCQKKRSDFVNYEIRVIVVFLRKKAKLRAILNMVFSLNPTMLGLIISFLLMVYESEIHYNCSLVI
ncbi:hypothetical protein CN891_23225 [Bacillus toyonensis]|nr:hypothetical protein BK702_28705 [Bacillus thuringiensis serovar cameroun]OTX13380.1 hypothetical protein BK712_01395 [Bacillus thuringiensis serovar seoulensis]PEB20665.1 hypothetical protein COO08_00725 [Bacillus toyonensis]PEF95601.1 hypothetical protein COO01_28980 [Bacillus toyonensis]PEJ84434.1 hypothetical protein CN891_23225 [Bacillus toyonensis]